MKSTWVRVRARVSIRVNAAHHVTSQRTLAVVRAITFAARGSLFFFLLIDLRKVHSFYKYSLDAFLVVITRSVESVTLRVPKPPKEEKPTSCCSKLFCSVSRSLETSRVVSERT